MKNVVPNLKIILIRKFKDFTTFEEFLVVYVVYYDYLLHVLVYRENEDFRGIILISSMPASSPYDKYGWISEVYNV